MENKMKIAEKCSEEVCDKQETKIPQELSKEQLTGMLHQISEQDRKLFEENKKLRSLIDNMDMSNAFKRLDYLFRIINEDNEYVSDNFKRKCGSEIEYILTAPEEVETKE